MKFPIFLVVLVFLSDCRITSFTRGEYKIKAPVPIPVYTVPIVPQWQPAGYGSAFGIL
ncbi:hypothetical protein ACJMK2_017625, partial [Sinanodonta woodiana]